MIKKKLICAILVLVMILSCTSLSTLATGDESARMKAYYDVVTKLIDKYGEGEIATADYYETGYDYMTGVGTVRLIDFDGDGKLELYCAYSDNSDHGDWARYVNKQAVYGYDNGLVVLLPECDVRSEWNDLSPTTHLIYKANTVYLEVGYFDIYNDYYTVRNGKMVSALGYNVSGSWGYDDPSKDEYLVNGRNVTSSAYEAAYAELIAGGREEYIWYCWDYDESPFDGTPYGVNPTDLIKTQEAVNKLRSYGSVPTLTAKPTASAVLVNGKSVSFDAYNISDNNYFKLRDLAYVLSGTEAQFEITWDGAKNAIMLTSGKSYTPVGGEMSVKANASKTPVATSAKVYLDGRELSLTAYNIDGNNYFKLRDIGNALNFGVDWDGGSNTIVINTSVGYAE